MLPTLTRNFIVCLLLFVAVGCEYGLDNGGDLIPPPVSTESKGTETAPVDAPLSAPEGSVIAADFQAAPLSQPATSAPVAETEPVVEQKTLEPMHPMGVVSQPLTSTASPLSTPLTSGPREIKLLVPQANFAPEGPNGPLRVKYDDLDLLLVLNMDPVPLDAVDHFPGWLKALEGKKVRIRGFMYPPPRQDGITFFQLARDNEICCFGRDPKVYDLIAVEMAKGTSTSYIANRPFDVVGVFHIDPFIDGDKMYELYRLDQASVITR